MTRRIGATRFASSRVRVGNLHAMRLGSRRPAPRRRGTRPAQAPLPQENLEARRATRRVLCSTGGDVCSTGGDGRATRAHLCSTAGYLYSTAGISALPAGISALPAGMAERPARISALPAGCLLYRRDVFSTAGGMCSAGGGVGPAYGGRRES